MFAKRRYMISILSLALFGLLGTAGSAAAQPFPPVRIVDAEYAGSGCPQGTARVALHSDTLSIFPEQYLAVTAPGRPTVRKSCNVAVVLRVPPGYSIALFATTYRGFAEIPQGGMGRLHGEFFWAGQTGPRHTHYFPPGTSGNWTVIEPAGAKRWSRCGGDVIARANTNVVARKEAPFSPFEAQVQVDTVDIYAGVEYQFVARPCRPGLPADSR